MHIKGDSIWDKLNSDTLSSDLKKNTFDMFPYFHLKYAFSELKRAFSM